MMRGMKVSILLVMLLVVPFVPLFAQSSGTPQTVDLMWLAWVGSIAALGFALILGINVLKKDPGNETTRELSAHIQAGALAYIKQQYKVVAIFFAVLFVLFLVLAFSLHLISPFVPFAFLTGGFFSGLSGFIGMSVATRANARTAWASQTSLNSGLRVAFSSGTVMGMVVVGLGILDLAIWWAILHAFNLPNEEIPPIMITFGMGASTMALFARLGGGIFTKAADVGADLVGKVEIGLPEDDARNPATIADNVGDNVGDVAGMGADLYESYVGSIVATMALGSVASLALPSISALQFIQIPVVIAAVGIIASIIGTFVVRAKENATQKVLLGALRRGIYLSTVLIVIGSFILVIGTVGTKFLGIWGALIAGLVAGNIIGFVTEYYTSDNYKPTKSLAAEAQTGPATIIIGGLSLGMLSTLIPVLTVGVAILVAFSLSGGFVHPEVGLYGIGLSAVGMLSTLGITLATDAYGPVADNAGGIAQMASLEPVVRERTDALDALGNTTAATGKGFAIGSAALTALALLAEYSNKIGDSVNTLFHTQTGAASAFEQLEAGLMHVVRDAAGVFQSVKLTIDLLDPRILVGLFFGAMLPFVFSSLSMRAVGRAAGAMVNEVRRQIREKPGIMAGTDKPDYAACVAISTKGAQREMVLPTIVAVASPIVIGILLGPFAVVALLAGSLGAGFVLAVMMANSGGAWDNAKKHIENGNYGGKGSDNHKASVVGDTVGDPFKDTSGPSINILLKLMSMVSIVFVQVVIVLHNYVLRLFL